MRKCFIHNEQIESVFQLLGRKENDMTYSLGWALSQSDSLFAEFVKSIRFPTNETETEIRLQRYVGKGKGFTDVEIEGKKFHLIVEAKRGWSLPSLHQLRKYERRLKNCDGKAAIVILSECSDEYFHHYRDTSGLDAEVLHVPWKNLYWIAKKAMGKANHAGKRLLGQFTTYLEKIMRAQNRESNWVYVVSVARGTPEGWKISWRDIVERKRMYFHPISGRWPKEPPNYIAFRYDGRLQSIHHIRDCKDSKDVHDIIKEIPRQPWGPYFVYKLGPAIKPPREVRTGSIFKNRHVKCMLDTLLTCRTISEARDVSKKRTATSK